MADQNTILQLRELIAELEDEGQYTNQRLSEALDAAGLDLNKTAGRIWRAKALTVAVLVDTSEGGSSRKNSQLYDRYMAIAERLDPTPVPEETPAAIADSSPRSRRAVRG
jgi:hypothetical protein